MGKIIAWKVRTFDMTGGFGGKEENHFFHDEGNAKNFFEKSHSYNTYLSYIDEQLVEYVLTCKNGNSKLHNYNDWIVNHATWDD